MLHELQARQIQLEKQTEQLRRTRAQLDESLARYADLYDFAPVGCVTSNKEGLVLEANLTFAGRLGMERHLLINTPLWRYMAAPDKDKCRAHLQAIFKTSHPQTCQLRLEKHGGPASYVQLDSIRVLNAEGAPLCRTTVTRLRFQEEPEKRVQERRATFSENRKKYRKLWQEFNTLLNAISDTLVLFSPEMEVMWTNSQTLKLRETATGAVEQYCRQLLQGHEAFSGDSPVTRCFNTAEKAVAVVNHNGAVLDVKVFPIKEEDEVRSALLLISDITEKMALQAEAMQAAHMASLGELAAGVAHEINNPITGIINYGQILINECPADSLEKDIGQRIVKEGERIGQIVKTLLSYARDGGQEKVPIRIPAVFEESIVLTQAQIRKEGIDLKADLPHDLPEVNGNFQQIQQGFINIINNARYALNEKYPGRDKNKRLEITGEAVSIGNRRYVRIVFHDYGIGVSPHELSVLTKPFYSTKPSGKGTGLGLSITHKIIMDHGGRLRFESTKGKFTRVVVELPADQRGGP